MALTSLFTFSCTQISPKLSVWNGENKNLHQKTKISNTKLKTRKVKNDVVFIYRGETYTDYKELLSELLTSRRTELNSKRTAGLKEISSTYVGADNGVFTNQPAMGRNILLFASSGDSDGRDSLDGFYAMDSQGTIFRFKTKTDANGVAFKGDYVLFSDDSGNVYLFDWRKKKEVLKLKAGEFPKALTLEDVNGDGKAELLVGSADGKLRVFNLRGKKLCEITCGDVVTSSPAVGDLDGDGGKEIVFGSADGKLYVVDGRSGEVKATFDAASPLKVPVAVGDIDGDGRDEAVFITQDGNVYVYKYGKNKPLQKFEMDGFGYSPPVLADVNGDGKTEIIATSWRGTLYVFSPQKGKTLWEFSTNGDWIFSSPLVADLDGDGKTEVLLTDAGGNLFVLDGKNGRLKLKFKLPSGAVSSPALYDINGDGKYELALVGKDGFLRVYSLNLFGGKGRWVLWHGDDGGSGNLKEALKYGSKAVKTDFKILGLYPLAVRLISPVELKGGKKLPEGLTGWLLPEKKQLLVGDLKIPLKQLKRGQLEIFLPQEVFLKKPIRWRGETLPYGVVFKIDRKTRSFVYGTLKIPFGGVDLSHLLPLSVERNLVLKGQSPIYNLPGGSIVGFVRKEVFAEEASCVKGFCYLNVGEVEGYIPKSKLEYFEPFNKTVAVLRSSGVYEFPEGREEYMKNLVSEGAVFRASHQADGFVYIPELKGWVEKNALKVLKIAKQKPAVYVVKSGAEVYKSPYSDIVLGTLEEGKTLKVDRLVKTEKGDFALINYGGRLAFVPLGELVKIFPEKGTAWSIESVFLRLSPGGHPFYGISPYQKLKVLAKADNGFTLVETEKGIKGWVERKALTFKKPDLFPPKVYAEGGIPYKLYVLDDVSINTVYLNGKPLLGFVKIAKPPYPKPFNGYGAADIRLYPVERSGNYTVVVSDKSSKKSEWRVILTPSKVAVKPLHYAEQPANGFLTKEEKELPLLKLHAEIIDENGNGILEGNERVKLTLKVKNAGRGTARGVQIVFSKGKELGLPSQIDVGDIPPSGERTKSVTFIVNKKLKSGSYEIEFYAKTARGFSSPVYVLPVVVKAYTPPEFSVEPSLEEKNGNGKLEVGELATLTLKVANRGGTSRGMEVKLKFPSYAVITKGKTDYLVPVWNAGEVKTFKVSFVVSPENGKTPESVPVKLEIYHLGRKIFEKTVKLPINKYLPVVIIGSKKPAKSGEELLPLTDLDSKVLNLKPINRINEKALAVVIGIGSYEELPPSVYSDRDTLLIAAVFRKVYGIEPRVLLNEKATYLRIRNLLRSVAAASQGKEVYIYYSGHGYVSNGAPAIVPTDADAAVSPDSTISWNWVLNLFKKFKPAKLVVFTDSCFSGYDRSGKPLTPYARPVVLISQGLIIPDKTLYISATSPKGRSFSVPSLKHGLFTYYLAKALLEGDINRDGKIELDELKRFLQQVKVEAERLNLGEQNPTIKDKGVKIVIEKP